MIFPEIFSEAEGLKVTVIGVLWPAFNVIGVVTPLTTKSFAFTLTCEMVRVELPLLLSVTVFALELPALIPVKVKLFGHGDSVTEAAVPVPLSDNTFGEFGALLKILTVPVCAPAAVGAKRALNVAVPPA